MNKDALRRFAACVTIVVLAACASAPAQRDAPVVSPETQALPPDLRNIRIGHPMDGVYRGDGTYVLIKKNGTGWEVVNLSYST
jgi:hypothetical protein